MTRDHISVDRLADAIQTTLEEFSGATEEALRAAIDDTEGQILDQLHTTSPRMTGTYAMSWTGEVWQKHLKGKYSRLISNKEYRLTHLLENGHRLVRDGRNVGFSPAKPHILQARERAKAWIGINLAKELDKA